VAAEAAGYYDVRLVAKDGHTCFVRNVGLTKKNSFLIMDGQRTGCH